VRRLAFALLLLAAAAARAQAPPPRPAPPTSLVFRVTDYGATPNDGSDDTAAVQRAVDAAIAASRRPTNGAVADRVVVDCGSGWYDLASPIYVDADSVTIRGDGAWFVQTGRCPAFAVGVHRVESGRAVDDTYRPGGAAIRVGPAGLKYCAGPLDLGQMVGGAWDHYGRTDRLTVECLVRAERKANQFWFGNGLPGGQESPWAVWTPSDNPDLLNFAYKTEGQSRANESPFLARVSLAGYDRSQPLNVCFQLDLSTGRAWAWVNGVRVPTDDAGDQRTPGKRFLCNEGVNPFTIGYANGGEPTDGAVANLTFFGLSVAATLKYRDVPIGGGQFRADTGEPADNTYRYNPWTLPGLLDSLQPSIVRGDRRGVVFQNGYGFFRHPTVGNGQFTSGARLQGLNLRTNGVGVLVGNTLTTRLDDLLCEGVRGVSSFSGLSSYTIYLNGCRLSGSDTPLFVRWMDLASSDLEVNTGGVDSLRIADSSASFDTVRFWFAGPNPRRVVSFLGGQYGGQLVLRKAMVDYEGNTVSDCGILLEQTAYTPATVDIENFTFGTVGKVPLVRCRQWADPGGGVYWPDTITARNLLSMADDYTAAVETNGPAWQGTVYAPYLKRGVASVDPKGRPSNVVMGAAK
jgi:hypothetical protein